MDAATRWSRVKDLFTATLEQDPDTWDSFLEAECGEDRGLLADVRSLLARDPADQTMVGAAVRAAARQLTAAADAGIRIGPYRVVRELGRGGMGTVYLAERDDGQFDRQVALKLIQRGLDSVQIVSRFRRERQILAGLRHPNIASLLDGGIADDGRPYFAMEYVEGEPIDTYCDRLRLSIEDRLALFLPVCDAVSHAHGQLVVHRDLKPDNILVTASGKPQLLDFGIAKVLAEHEGPATLTETGHMAMTPAYASPEQVRGQSVGTATDVYSLGIVLYELLAGTAPYDLSGVSLPEVARMVCETEPGRPSNRTTTPRLKKQLAGDLDAICLKAMRKEPGERYATVDALAEDIRRHLNGLPVHARTGTWSYRVRKGIRRHRLAVATAAFVVTAIASVIGFYTVRLTTERDRAQLEAAKASEVAGFLQGLFEVSDPSQSRGETVTARELLDEGARRIEQGLVDQPEVRATMLRVIGEVYGGIGLQEQARTLLEHSLELHLALYGPDNDETAMTQASLGSIRQDLGDAEGAEALFRAALATMRGLHGPEHPLVSEVLSLLAYWNETEGHNEEAEALFREALAQDRVFFPRDDPRVARSMVKLAGLLRRMDEFEEAEQLLRDGLAIQRGAHGTLHPDVATTVRNLGALLRDMGEYTEADTLYREALAIRREILGQVHPEVANTLNSYAILLSRMGETDRALDAFREFIELLRQIYDGPHPSLAAAYSNLAFEFKDLDRLEEAAAYFRLAIGVQDSVLTEDHPNRAFPLIGLGGVHLEQDRPAAAEPFYRRALELRRASLPPEHTQIGEATGHLGATLTALGRFAEAQSLLIESYEIYRAADGDDAGRTRNAAERLARLYEASNQPDRAAHYRTIAAGPS